LQSLVIMYTTPLSTLISSCSLNHHLYADDTQLLACWRSRPVQASRLTFRAFRSPGLSLFLLPSTTLPGPSASEVTTLSHYTNAFIIIIIIITTTTTTTTTITSRDSGDVDVAPYCCADVMCVLTWATGMLCSLWLVLLTFATAFVLRSSVMVLACPHLICILSFSVCLLIVSSRP